MVIDISETKCTLRWEPSEDDGGADVKHYIVEYFRDVWEVWLKAKTTKDTMVTIDDLIPGSRYKFRIKAENSYGISEPGDESDPFDVGGVSAERYENRCPDFLHDHNDSSFANQSSSAYFSFKFLILSPPYSNQRTNILSTITIVIPDDIVIPSAPRPKRWSDIM